MTPTKEASASLQKDERERFQPRSFEQFIGQPEGLRRLAKLVAIARQRGAVLPHILLVGLEGSGKRTMTHLIARQLGVNLRATSGAMIERASDLAAIINDLDKGDVLLLENIKRLNKVCAEILPHTLRDFELRIVVGKGPSARQMSLAVKPFTFVATAEKQSDCPPDLLHCFDVVIQFQRYQESELVQLIERLATQQGISLDPLAAELIARFSDGNPGRAESLIRYLRLVEKRPITEHDAREILSVFGHGSGNRAINSSLSGIELSSLSEVAFEKLIATMLSGMGFVAEMTKTSGDGGIDIEAVLNRPIVGGRYLFQCKRFAPDNLVGSPTIREFYGAVVADRKAIKGILITTSGFTPQARDFAENLPIELIDGDQLDHLLRDNVSKKSEEEA